MRVADPLFLDTSLIVAATVEAHPSHRAAAAFIDAQVAAATPMCISSQVGREFLVVLTRQPVSGRAFTLDEALEALDVWTTGCMVLDEREAVFRECVRLVRRHGVHGKQVHDCNIVATMLVHRIPRLATRNAPDFKRFGQEIEVESVVG